MDFAMVMGIAVAIGTGARTSETSARTNETNARTNEVDIARMFPCLHDTEHRTKFARHADTWPHSDTIWQDTANRWLDMA